MYYFLRTFHPNLKLIQNPLYSAKVVLPSFVWNYMKIRGQRVIRIFRSLIWSKTTMELIFNPCGEFRWSLEGPVSQIHSPHLQIGAPGLFSDLLRSVQILKREWVQKATGSYHTYSIPGKTAALVPAFAVKDLPLGRTLWWLWWWYENHHLLHLSEKILVQN